MAPHSSNAVPDDDSPAAPVPDPPRSGAAGPNAPGSGVPASPPGGPGTIPDDVTLPPIEPPSAGFIVQLFVVPAIIVVAVIGVYLLFGKLASSDVDWRELVVDLRSGNTHTRWRGANGLAQLLEADALVQRMRRGEDPDLAPPLSSDQELATELAATLQRELERPAGDADQQRLVEYLIKSLGWMDVPDVVVPALLSAFEQNTDPFLRQQTLIALGMVAGRADLQGTPLDQPELTRLLLDLSHNEPDVLRHLAVYNLGFLDDAEAESRLKLLLGDADEKTRLNAAVGLARRKSPDALPVFESILANAAKFDFDPRRVATSAEGDVYFERKQSLSNALSAAEHLREILTPEQRARFVALIDPLTEAGTMPDNDLRHRAITARHALAETP